MLGTELAYVREKLAPLDLNARKAVAADNDLHVKTLNRIISKKTKYGRYDTIGKLAMYFRTRDRRRNGHRGAA